MQSVVKSISRGSALQSQSGALKTKSHFLHRRKETPQCEIILHGVALFVLRSLRFGPQLLSAEESKSNEIIRGILGVNNCRNCRTHLILYLTGRLFVSVWDGECCLVVGILILSDR